MKARLSGSPSGPAARLPICRERGVRWRFRLPSRRQAAGILVRGLPDGAVPSSLPCSLQPAVCRPPGCRQNAAFYRLGVRERVGAPLFRTVLEILLRDGKGVFAAGLENHVPDNASTARGIRELDIVMAAGIDPGQLEPFIGIDTAVRIVPALVRSPLRSACR